MNTFSKFLLGAVPALLLAGFINISIAHAQEYQCNITATAAAGCEAYSSVSHTCRFPQELNEKRSAEAQSGSYTYPEFCSVTCAEQSGIPKKCRAGRISTAQPVAAAVVSDAPEEAAVKEDLQKNSIIENAYKGAKLALSRFWNWLKEVSAGEDFQIEPSSTPVAGVRG